MATLHLMVGLPLAGKTTLAKQLEQEYSALRLNIDEWHTRLFGNDVEAGEHDARHSLIEAMLWDIAARRTGVGGLAISWDLWDIPLERLDLVYRIFPSLSTPLVRP
jgi:predicted kinase